MARNPDSYRSAKRLRLRVGQRGGIGHRSPRPPGQVDPVQGAWWDHRSAKGRKNARKGA